MDTSLAQFVRGLYFEVQTIEGVQALEIWDGIHERHDSFGAASLMKNLCKIVIPLVNERCFGRAFTLHAQRARETLAALAAWFEEDPESRLYERFPYPPTGDGDQKELYRVVRARAGAILEQIDADAEDAKPAAPPSSTGMFPDGLFDFREMRIVDNELPYIIFTEKEFRVIHGLAIVYAWLIDVDAIYLESLGRSGVDSALIDEYRAFARRVQKEIPLVIKGRKIEPRELIAHLGEKLKYEDYLDLFENVHSWYEEARSRLG